MDVWQEEAYPWLIAEKAFIKKAVEEKGLPFLGPRPSIAGRHWVAALANRIFQKVGFVSSINRSRCLWNFMMDYPSACAAFNGMGGN